MDERFAMDLLFPYCAAGEIVLFHDQFPGRYDESELSDHLPSDRALYLP